MIIKYSGQNKKKSKDNFLIKSEHIYIFTRKSNKSEYCYRGEVSDKKILIQRTKKAPIVLQYHIESPMNIKVGMSKCYFKYKQAALDYITNNFNKKHLKSI